MRPFASSRLAVVPTLLVVALAHARVLAAPLLWDDRTLIPFVAKAPLGALLSTPLADVLGPGNAYYRPVALFFLGLEARLFDSSPAALHAISVALHLTCVALLFHLLRRRGVSPAASAFGTALWGLFPRLTEDVGLITGQMDVLAAVFGLAALACWQSDRPIRRVGSALLLFLALSSKEVAIAFFVAIAVRAWLDLGARRSAAGLAPLGVAFAAWWVCRMHAGLSTGSAIGSEALGVRVPRALEATGRYALMVVDPLRPRIAIGSRDVRDTSIVMLGGAVIVALALLAWARRRSLRDAASAEAVALFVVGLLPVLEIVPLKLTPLVCDRFLYVPLAGVALLATPAVSAAVAERGRAAAGALASAAVLSFGIATSLRAADMASELRFWSVALAVERVDTTPVRNNAAAAFAAAHEWRRARTIDEDTLRRGSDDRKQRHRLAVSLVATGETARAIELARALVAAYPQDLGSWRTYAGAAMAARDYGQARFVVDRIRATFGASFGDPMMRDVDELERASSSSTTEGLVARARLLRKVGAEDEADATWLAAVGREDLGPDRLREAIVDLVDDGSYDAVSRALTLAGARLGPMRASADLLAAARRAEREDADDAWRRVVACGRVADAR